MQHQGLARHLSVNPTEIVYAVTIEAVFLRNATRRVLCSMVESGKIDLDRAARIFEMMRESLIEVYRKEEQESKKGKNKRCDSLRATVTLLKPTPLTGNGWGFFCLGGLGFSFSPNPCITQNKKST